MQPDGVDAKTHEKWHAEKKDNDWVCNCQCPDCWDGDNQCLCSDCTCHTYLIEPVKGKSDRN